MPTSSLFARITRAALRGCARYVWSWPLMAVATVAWSKPNGPGNRLGTCGISVLSPPGRSGMTPTPKVGHLGRWPSWRSNSSSGKLVMTPPSTISDVRPELSSVSLHGTKNSGIVSDMRTARATDCPSGPRGSAARCPG